MSGSSCESSRRPRGRKHGFTLIEVIVAITVIALFSAFLIPAVQSARNMARRAACLSNLRQLGLAVNAYVADTGVFPPGANGRRAYSLHSMVLPYLGNQILFNSINFQLEGGFIEGGANLTVQITRIDSFLCPSDVPSPGLGAASTSYAGNGGNGYQKFGYNGVFGPGIMPVLGPQAIVDGMSSTVMIAECLVGANQTFGGDQRRFTRMTLPYPDSHEFDEFVIACLGASVDSETLNYSDKGLNWLHGELNHTLYNHVMNINANTCLN